MNIKFKKSQYIIGNQVEFLNFMRTRAQLIHLSNVFFRDLHFAVMEFLKKKNVKVGQTESEMVAREVALHFEKKNIFKKLNMQTWMLNYTDYAIKKAV
jgi:glycogen debranching enzyme